MAQQTVQATDGTTDGAHDILCECETAWAMGSTTDGTGDGWCNRWRGQQAVQQVVQQTARQTAQAMGGATDGAPNRWCETAWATGGGTTNSMGNGWLTNGTPDRQCDMWRRQQAAQPTVRPRARQTTQAMGGTTDHARNRWSNRQHNRRCNR